MEIKDVEKALIRFDIKDERVSAVDLGPVGAFSDLVRSQGREETLAPVKSFEKCPIERSFQKTPGSLLLSCY